MKILLSLVMLMIYASLFSVLLYLSTNKTKTINNNNNINKLLRIYKSEKAFNEINYNFTNRTLNKSSIFCMILTSKKNLESRVSITYEAWAHKCDDHDFVLLIPGEEKKIGQRIEKKINNAFKLLQPESLLNDSYEQLTDKVYHMFIDAYKYKKKYDWYVKADDDTFLFVDNLRQFLHNKNSSEAVSYGYDFKVKAKNGYQSGGAGYVLSKQAFERLGSALINNYTFCPNSGTEDIDCISCLESLGVKKGKSTDSLGREKFFPQNILDFFYGTNIEWLKEWAKNPVPVKGLNCCSESIISFHKVSPIQIKELGNFINTNSNFKFADIINVLKVQLRTSRGFMGYRI